MKDILTSLPGSVQAQYRTVNGKTYGPYYFRFWRERGRLRKKYVPRDQVDAIRAKCARYDSPAERRRKSDRFTRDWGRLYDYFIKCCEGRLSKRDLERGERLLERVTREGRFG
jgi:hypothetical protein